MAILSKSLIPFSDDGQGCVPSLLLDLRPNYGRGNEDNGDLLQKVPCTHGYTQCPQLQQATADPRLHRGLLDTHRQVCFGIIFIYLKKQIQGGQIDQEIDSISPYVKEESN